MPVGTWDVTYSNGAHHVCRIAPDGAWEKLDGSERRPTRLRVNEKGELVLTHRDGDDLKAERYHTTADGLLIVEHFNPASTVDKGPPTTIGIGRRVEDR